MDLFDTIAGVCSIISLIVSLITISNVVKIKNQLSQKSEATARQFSHGNNSPNINAGRDVR